MQDTSSNYWIQIPPSGGSLPTEEEGKWVVFLRRNFSGVSASQRQKLIDQLQGVIDRHSLQGAIVTSRNMDVACFFTSADREEIWRVKRVLMAELGIKGGDLIWKADFETLEDWEPGKGQLWFLSELVDAYDRKDAELGQGNSRKAEGIQRKAIDPLLTRFKKSMLEESALNRSSMIVRPAFPAVDYEIDPSLIFLLIPFSESWSDDLRLLIEDAAHGLPLEVKRSDDIFDPEIIVNDVWKLINKASLVIADITVHNANVFYELGIAHAIGKKVVLIRQHDSPQAPFDVASWRQLEYGLTPRDAKRFKTDLRGVLVKHSKRFA